jgi:hypothetical protein
MNVKRFFLTGLLVSIVSLAGFSSASSRIWKATREAKARDYVTINDTRANGDLVLLLWFVPQMVQAGTPGAANFSAILQKYVIMMAVHGHLDKTSGSVSFDDLTTLEARDQAGKPLPLMARKDLPPTTIAALSGMEALFRQSFGAMGNGMKMFVFDSGEVSSCKNGKLSVPLAGETYTWNTPIPGCP